MKKLIKKLKKALLVVLVLSYFIYVKSNNAFATKIRKSRSYPQLVLDHDGPSTLSIPQSYSCFDLTLFSREIYDNEIETNDNLTKATFSNSKIKRSAILPAPHAFIKKTLNYVPELGENAIKVSCENFSFKEIGYNDANSQNLEVTIPFSNSQDSITFDLSEKIISIPTDYLPTNELSDEGEQYFEELSQQNQQFLEDKCSRQSASDFNIPFLNNSDNSYCKHNEALLPHISKVSDRESIDISIEHKRSCSFIPQDFSCFLFDAKQYL